MLNKIQNLNYLLIFLIILISFVGAAGAGHTTLRAHDESEGESLLEQFIQESISSGDLIVNLDI